MKYSKEDSDKLKELQLKLSDSANQVGEQQMVIRDLNNALCDKLTHMEQLNKDNVELNQLLGSKDAVIHDLIGEKTNLEARLSHGAEANRKQQDEIVRLAGIIEEKNEALISRDKYIKDLEAACQQRNEQITTYAKMNADLGARALAAEQLTKAEDNGHLIQRMIMYEEWVNILIKQLGKRP